MNLITNEYYLTDYKGEDPDDDILLTKLIQRASDDVNALCNWELPEDITTLDDIVAKNLLYKATAAQTEWYVLNGETFNDDGSASVSIGKFSYSGNTKSKNSNTSNLCARAYQYIEPTGYLFRGC